MINIDGQLQWIDYRLPRPGRHPRRFVSLEARSGWPPVSPADGGSRSVIMTVPWAFTRDSEAGLSDERYAATPRGAPRIVAHLHPTTRSEGP